jgi:hypothetical protein
MCNCTSEVRRWRAAPESQWRFIAFKKSSGINAIVSSGVPLFAVFGGAYISGMSGSTACAAALFGRTVDFKFRPDLRGERAL